MIYYLYTNERSTIIYRNSLPAENLKQEVSDFVGFLKTKYEKEPKITQRQYGYAKGFFKMSDDFDEPLEGLSHLV